MGKAKPVILGKKGSFLNMWCFVIAPILESMGRKFDFLDTHADR